MNSKFDPFPNARLFLFHIVIPGGGIELEPGKGGGKVKKRNTHTNGSIENVLLRPFHIKRC